MRDKKAAISIYTLLACLFFLIFIMVAYNNISQKAQTQVETTAVLVDAYKSSTDSETLIESMISSTVATTNVATTAEESEAISSADSGTYFAIKGTIYKK